MGIAKTGSRDEWCANNIYDFAGNVKEYTQEQYKSSCCVVRGGDAGLINGNLPVADRDYKDIYDSAYGFRAALYIR